MLDSDFPDPRLIVSSESVYRGKIWEVVRDKFEISDIGLTRDFVKHPGAVAVVALNEAQEVLLISQYRHPVAHTMIEIPAGLLDRLDEDPLEAAKRELAEESGYSAANWSLLIDFCTSPGSSSEAVRIYLASDLQPILDSSFIKTAEESEIQIWFESLAVAVSKVFAGEIQSPTAAVGLLAASIHSSTPQHLRNSDSKWRMRETLIAENRVFEF
jgi:8-oxo-dGDP phosphatase